MNSFLPLVEVMEPKKLPTLVLVIVVAAIYFGAGKLGLSLAFLHANVSPVWPPTGVAIAAILWLGYRVSPAVLLGAFLVNLATGVSAPAAGGIAAGNTLEALTAVFLLHRFAGSGRLLDRPQGVLKFVFITGVLSTTVSATIGNISLCLGGASAWADFGSLWLTWWLGDGVGALVVAPLLLTWLEKTSESRPAGRSTEGALLLVSLSIVALVVFGAVFPTKIANYPLAHLTIPFLLWAAFRFGLRGAATAIALLTGIADWGTTRGFGPFVVQSPNESLLFLQAFVAAVAITALVVAAIVAEYRRAQSSIAFLASLVESTDDAVIGKTLDGIIASWNEGAERLYGYAAEEAIGRSVSMLIPPDHADDLAQILARIKRGETIDHYETVRVRKDGNPIDVSLTISPIMDSSGRISAASTIARNITERKRVAAERERLLAGERGARELAEAANRLKDEFLGTISHELRTPLSAILGWTALLHSGKLDEKSTARALETVERNAQSQARLIEDLLDVSRIIGGKVNLDVRPVELESVVKAAIDVIGPAAARKGIELETVFEPGAGLIAGDPHRLQQVMWNLLSNAVKFTPKGGRVEVRLKRVGSSADITVSDTGEGLKAEFLPFVFDRFWQADSTHTRRHGGLGLGLSIVRHLVGLHQGTVEVASAGPGLGATFTVRLPLAAGDGEASPGDAPRKEPAGDVALAGARVLVVEYDPDTREMIRVTLELHGAEVRSAASARQALDLLDEWTPEVLVSDIEMADEDGSSLIEKVRARKPGAAIRTVALTGYAGLDDADRARRAGYQMHVAKPIEPERLVGTIASLAGRSQKGLGA